MKLDNKKMVLSLVIVLIFVALVMSQKTEVEKEIEYYKDEGYKTVEMTLMDFYERMPDDLSTREVEVSSEKLRFRVHLAMDLFNIEKYEMAVLYDPDKTRVWALCYTLTSDTLGYIEVLFWEP